MSKNNEMGGGCGWGLIAVQILLVVLQIFEIINWPWYLLLLPTWLILFGVVLTVLVTAILYLLLIYWEIKDR